MPDYDPICANLAPEDGGFPSFVKEGRGDFE